MAQLPRTPDLDAQRIAMQRLSLLVGKWSGEARVLHGPGQWIDLRQTEEAQYKLDGLVLMIEGIGRTAPEGTVVLQALAIISYDDESNTYHMRAFNDGRFLETEVKLAVDRNELARGFAIGDIKTTSVMRITETGEWTESHEIALGQQPPKRLMELTVRRES